MGDGYALGELGGGGMGIERGLVLPGLADDEAVGAGGADIEVVEDAAGMELRLLGELAGSGKGLV